MRVAFHIPPPPQRLGGLDAAILGLSRALGTAGVTVEISEDPVPQTSIAHFHGLWQPRFPVLARAYRKQGSALIISPHGMLEPWAWRHKWWKKWPYYLLRERAFLAAADCLLATSPMEAARLKRRFPRSNVATLPLGLTSNAGPGYSAARQDLGWSEGETVLLFLSRVHPKKGLDLLLEALVGNPERETIRLVIVGGGSARYLEQLQKFCRANSTQLPRVEWVGEVWGDERWKYFQGADLFCLPSHSENFGLAVLEALQVGTPVLTTEDTPWPQLASGPRLYISAPQVRGIRASLTAFLQAPPHAEAARITLAEQTRQQFSWDHLAGRYIELYRQIATAE